MAPQPGTPMAPVMDPSSTYSFDDSDDFARASADKIGAGYVYTRWANPTVDAFEAAVAELEGAEAAEAFATGMAAISTTLLAYCRAGDRVVSSPRLYGGTWALFNQVLPRYGIEATFVDFADTHALEEAARGAKLIYCETISNPRMDVVDLEAIASVAHKAGIPMVVDNTFASPVLCRPIELGADISLHSATKFLGGHHDLMGGVVCGSSDALEPIRDLARELGPTLAPFNAWLALRGIATVHLRVDRSCETAVAIARMLAEHEMIEEVRYPGLEGDPSHSTAGRVLGGRGGGTMGFEVKGGRERAARFQEALRVISPAASLGGTHSLIVHAASVTHTQLDAAQLAEVGISEGWCRLSVGVESCEDLLADLTQALG